MSVESWAQDTENADDDVDSLRPPHEIQKQLGISTCLFFFL